MAIPTLSHTVKKGETLIGIVKKHGFDGKSYKSIYNAPYNAKLKKKRPDPNVIMPGDIVNYPIVTKKALLSAWDVVFDIQNSLADPLIEAKNRLLRQIGVNKKKLADAKKELAQIRDDASVATPGYAKSYEKELHECQKPWLDKSRSLAELVNCKVAIAKYDADMKKLSQFYDELIKEEEENVAKFDARIKAAQARIKELDALIGLIAAPFEKSLFFLGKLSKETF